MKRTLLVLSVILFACQVWAQKTITGKVTDETGAPIANVSVTIKGSSEGTTTNADGVFSISVPANARALVFSSVDRETREQNIGSSNTISISLATRTQNLEEVVVVAYGSVKKNNFVGSAAQVDAKQFQNRPLSNPLNALVGSAPGIQTTVASGAPGSSPGIVVRGFGSLALSNGPLYVVDGAVYDGGFSNLNPDDIESLTVLKDASSTALYGSRGANGVVMITTKKGRRGKQSIQFKVQLGRSNPAIPRYETVDAFEYYPLAWESYRNGLYYNTQVQGRSIPLDSANMIASGTLPRYTSGPNLGRQIFRNGNFQDIYQVLGGYNPFNVGNTAIVGLDGKINPNANLLYGNDLNWLDQATRTGTRNEYGIQYTSGNDKSDISASVNYLKEGGWGLRSDFERFSGRVNASVKPTSWFKTGFNLAGNRSKFNNAATGGIVNAFYFARYIAPIYPVNLHAQGTGDLILDALGKPQFDLGNTNGYARPYNSGRHTIAEHLWNKDNDTRDVLSARSFAEVTFTPWLKATTNISLDITNNTNESYENPIVGDGLGSGRYSMGFTKTTSYTFNQILNFNKSFGVHNIDAIAGHENYSYKTIGSSGMRIGQSFDNIYMYSNFITINSLSSSFAEARTEGFFTRLNYDYGNKYLVSGSLRRDGNSKFASDVRWSNFWSVGIGWRIDQEDFFHARFVDMLKFRASYGSVGNAEGLGNYPYQAGYGIGWDNGTQTGVILNSLSSQALTWETQKPLDFGIDFSLFKGRISGTVEYFIRNSSGLIFGVPQPYQNGGTPSGNFTVSQNIGSMRNQGLEVQLTGNIIRSKDWNWNMTVNATSYSNKITKMPTVTPSVLSGSFRREVGHSIYDFWTRIYYGVDPADGQALYKGLTATAAAAFDPATDRVIPKAGGGNDTVTIDHNRALQTFTGHSALPDVYGSIQNTVSYKNFDLSVLLTYQIGGTVNDGVYGSLMSTATTGGTYHKDIFQRWQKPGDITNVPRLDNQRSTQYGAASTRFFTSASYLSISNISLAYRLPVSLLSKIKANNVRVFVSAENLHFFTKRKGMNVNGSFTGSTGDNYDAARILSAGLNLNF